MSKIKRAPGTAPGEWYIDDRCINCGAARDVAPGLIVERDELSVFLHQPQTEEELERAWLAAELCPTRSVRTESRQEAPDGVYPYALAPGIYLCGHNARSSFGAHSYFVKRSRGNVLVDSPVFTRKLLRPFEDMGGIAKIILTHRDDVADANKWATHFRSEVYIHKHDRAAAPFADHLVEGTGPSDPTAIDAELRLIPVPGHTLGSMMLLMNDRYLFTGDSLCWSRDKNALSAFRDACWYSWSAQKRSLAALASYEFEQVFPGHGAWSPRLSAETMREHLLALVDRM